MQIVDLASRPDLRDAAMNLGDVGGEFIYAGPSGKLIVPERFQELWPRYFLIGVEDGVPVGRARSHGRRAPTALCALEVVIAPRARGQGRSAPMLAALKARAAETGLRRLIVSVRPIGKEAEPEVPMVEYVSRRRPDGLFADRWLRTHERLGARMIKICPFAVTISGSLADWIDWSGVKLEDGENQVPGGIAPVYASVARDYAVYVEPNVWFEHPMD
jgi:hypothetical protein